MHKILQRRIIQGRSYLAEKDAFSALQEVLNVSVEDDEKVKESDVMTLDDELKTPSTPDEDELLFSDQLETEEESGLASAGWELPEETLLDDLTVGEKEYQVSAEAGGESSETAQEISPWEREEDAGIWYYWNGNFYKVDS
ncbi:MAG: hypothetical protein ACOX37_08955 [Bacillota bacterium]|jgi:hypothetical protein